MTRLVRLFAAIAALAALGGCAWDQGIRPFWTLHDTDFRQLKPGMTKEKLDIMAMKTSDNESAEEMTNEKEKLFNKILIDPVDF